MDEGRDPHPIPLSEPGRRLVATVAAELLNRLDEFSRHVDGVLLQDLPELAGAPDELREGLARSTRAHAALFPGMIGTWTDPRSVSPPPETLAWAIDVGRQGIPVETLLRAYRLGHAAISQFWLDLLSASAPDPGVLAETSAATSTYLFMYVDAILQPIITAYIAERERRAREAQSVREVELRRVLAGEPVDVVQSGQRLGYRLDRWHLGFVAWLPEGDVTANLSLSAAASATAKALGASESPLTLAATQHVLYGWIGSWSEPDEGSLPELAGVRLSAGNPGRGVEGFLQSHEQARLARRLSRHRHDEPPTLRYRDCDVASLLFADPDHAHDFVTAVLGSLTDDLPSNRKLLDTLAVYHQEGLSITRAAARLGVHPNTVTYRVRRVLEASGETDSGSLRLRAAVELAAYVERTTGPSAQR
jgi:hypothetical protein